MPQTGRSLAMFRQSVKRIRTKARRTAASIKFILAKLLRPQASRLNCTFSIDSPLNEEISQESILVTGWLIPDEGLDLKSMTVTFNSESKNMRVGMRRPDVAHAHPMKVGALTSGFSQEFASADGVLRIEADLGKGPRKIYEITLKYRPELSLQDLLNPELGQRMAYHAKLMESKSAYFFEAATTNNYQRHKNDPKLVAFYLPQFYPIEQNDRAWGTGFTEWTNVTSGTPRFVGHRQPLLPRDLGYYDLRLPTSMENQMTLAKANGLYGFCFYYYWFSGERLLEGPLNLFLANKHWDFHFAICWANENWTKKWDGRDSEIIIRQQYLDRDPLDFIKSVAPILNDSRYITVDGAPMLGVFRIDELPDPERYAEIWRKHFLDKFGKKLHLVAILSFDDGDPRRYGFDAAVDFAPHSSAFKLGTFKDHEFPTVDVTNKLIDIQFEGLVADYRRIALNEEATKFFEFPTYACVAPSWDNDARNRGRGFVLVNESPDVYQRWLDTAVRVQANKVGEPIVFINAWNEWAEGAMLEPSMHYGSALLNRTKETISSVSKAECNRRIHPWGIDRGGTKLAVIVHLYYTDQWNSIVKILSRIDVPFDLFVSVGIKDKKFESVVREDFPRAYVYVVPNRGRDILPFLVIGNRVVASGYEYILKLHGKKSVHRGDGALWFRELLESLVPNTGSVKAIIESLDKWRSLIGPSGHFASLDRSAFLGKNEEKVRSLLSELGLVVPESVLHGLGFFAGSMFWVHREAVEPALGLMLMPEDFEPESGELDGTTAHAMERLFSVLPQLRGSPMLEIGRDGGIDIVGGGAMTYRYV